MTDVDFTLLAPLTAVFTDLAGSARAYAPLLRRHIVERHPDNRYTATADGKALAKQQLTRPIA